MIVPLSGTPGELEEVRMFDWGGDGTNDRVIGIGGPFDLVLVFTNHVLAYNVDKLMLAYSFRDAVNAHVWGTLGHNASGAAFSQANSTGWFQGLVLPACTSIKLGSDGSNARGTNLTGRGYKAIAVRFRHVSL